MIFEDISSKVNQRNITQRYTPVVRYSRDVMPPDWDAMVLSIVAVANSDVNVTAYETSNGSSTECPTVGDVVYFPVHNISAGMLDLHRVSLGLCHTALSVNICPFE